MPGHVQPFSPAERHVRPCRATSGDVSKVPPMILCDDRDYLGIAAVTGQPIKIITET